MLIELVLDHMQEGPVVQGNAEQHKRYGADS
jgi:hypothetical protein